MDYDPSTCGIGDITARGVGFARELESLLNSYSQENASNTPDFILTQYLLGCLAAWNDAVKAREKWYGREADAFIASAPATVSALVDPDPAPHPPSEERK